MKKREKLEIVRRHFPNAITTIDAVNQFIDFVEFDLDLEVGKVMVADSICSDDVNSIQYPARMAETLGPFKMGGLDGFPFTGLTGMGAFASHVPDDGAVYIYYGPHIGVSKTGELGAIHRHGQHRLTGCCGAARAALGKLMAGQIEAGNVTELDYQMNTLEQILFREKTRILAAAEPLKEATEVIFEAIDQRIEELARATHYDCKYLILMGAILINSDWDMGSFSSLKKFVVIDLATCSRRDVMAEMSRI